MLDLSHPMTEHVFRASRLMDAVMVRGRKMSVSPSAIRAQLLAECLPLLDEMRDVARTRFAQRGAFILATVNEYEAAIRTLAELGGDRSSEDLDCECPACRTPITRFRLNPDSTQCEGHWIIHCQECSKPFMVAHEKLDSSEGFGTWVI